VKGKKRGNLTLVGMVSLGKGKVEYNGGAVEYSRSINPPNLR